MPSTVILGGGIMGLSTAYYLASLSRQNPDAAPHIIHIVEPCPELFASASGKAGGFIARDWFSPALANLGSLSFDLHRQLAQEHDGRARWGWSESISYSLDRNAGAGAADSDSNSNSDAATSDRSASPPPSPRPDSSGRASPASLAPHGAEAQENGSAQGADWALGMTRLCEFLLEECIAMGVRLHHPARATKLVHADPGNPASQAIIRVDVLATTSTGREFHTGKLDLPCDSLVLAAGCWTPSVFRTLFPRAPRVPTVQGLAGYSVTARSRAWKGLHAAPAAAPCHAVFTSDPSGFSPELYSRAGGELWVGGVNSAALPLPARAMDARPDRASIERIVAVARALCGDDVEVLQGGLCFRPNTPSGKPIVARVAEADLGEGVRPRACSGRGGGGVYLAVGHGPWGISLCLGTGLVLSEMILGRPTSADVGLLAQW
ncbi:hypothetical protein IEO21_05115 [Rhodonia placenta]|uniref:FAD dependent oxidoreductase domain-containing protein n=1 Tax=Rhodonia placenta TaxID=104341 RepID=A0A8H7P2I2_9APHY|nr:hypothetical protein IEO21_05115 [Postia placenta]